MCQAMLASNWNTEPSSRVVVQRAKCYGKGRLHRVHHRASSVLDMAQLKQRDKAAAKAARLLAKFF